jgi:WD40 repeat protein
MPPSREQLPTGQTAQRGRARRFTVPRWLLVLLVAAMVAIAAIFWIASGQGPLATIISVLFASLGLLLSVMQTVPAETARRSSPLTPVSSSSDARTPHQTPRLSTGALHETGENKQSIQEPRENWGDTPNGVHLYGRDRELAELTQWITTEHCRIVLIAGIGGIGKTSLAVTLAHQVCHDFSCVLWRSLQNAPPLSDILRESIQCFSSQQDTRLPASVEGQLNVLIDSLRAQRCLMILDNVESIMQQGDRAGHYQEGYADYGELFERIGTAEHQSCLVLTSREKPVEVSHHEGRTAFVRSLLLTGMDEGAAKQLLAHQGLQGTDEAWLSLVRLYGGNPLTLQLVSEPIRDLFGGDIAAFLHEGIVLIGDIHAVLAQQFQRLSPQEQEVLYWLAIEREPISFSDLQGDLVHPVPKGALLDILHSLRRRSLIEAHEHGMLHVQPVIMEYVTNHFLEQITQELVCEPAERLSLFERHALIKAHTKAYIRESQERCILGHVAGRLLALYGKAGSEKKLYAILAALREAASQGRTSGYAAGNILNLLISLHCDLQVADFSSTTVRQAYLRGVALPAVNFAHADLTDSVFTETFGDILAVTLNPAADRLVAGTTTGEIHVWHMPDGTPLLTLQGHRDWTRSVACSPDGSLLASGSDDQTVRVWDSKTGRCIKTLRGHRGRVYTVAFSHDGSLLASGGDDMTIRLWKVSNGECVNVYQGHEQRLRAIAFSPTDALLASGSADATIRLWECNTGACLKILQGHSGSVYTLVWNDDGSMLASGSNDRTVRLWDTGIGGQENGRCMHVLEGHQGKVYTVAFHGARNMLVSGSEDQTVRLWDAQSGQCVRILYGHSNGVRSVACSASQNMLASGGNDQAIRLWDMENGRCLNVLQGHSSWMYSVAFCPDGNLLAYDCEDHSLRLWSLDAQRPLHILRGHSSWIYSVAFSPDGKLLASGGDDQEVRLWNVQSGQCGQTLRGHAGRVRCVAFHPAGTLLASGGDDRSVRLWDVNTGECVNVLQGQGDRVRSLAFMPDGETVASAGENQTIHLWNVQTGACTHVLQGHRGRVWSVACSPAGVLASGGDDAAVRVWTLPAGQLSQTFSGHTGCIYTLAFTPDGKMLVSGSEDATVRLWDVETGHLLRTLRGHTSRVRAVAVNPAGSILASGSHDGTVRLWDMQTGDCIQTLSSERPYERMNITGARGITTAQREMLKALGAVD